MRFGAPQFWHSRSLLMTRLPYTGGSWDPRRQEAGRIVPAHTESAAKGVTAVGRLNAHQRLPPVALVQRPAEDILPQGYPHLGRVLGERWTRDFGPTTLGGVTETSDGSGIEPSSDGKATGSK